METRGSFLLFALAQSWFAIEVSLVEGIFLAAEVTSLPNSPPILKGLLNIGGEIHQVMDMHYLLGLPREEIHPRQRLILTRTEERSLLLLVDEVKDVQELPIRSLKVPLKSLHHSLTIQVARKEYTILPILDLESFLNPLLSKLEG